MSASCGSSHMSQNIRRRKHWSRINDSHSLYFGFVLEFFGFLSFSTVVLFIYSFHDQLGQEK